MVTRCTSWAYVAAVLLLTGGSTATPQYSGGTGEPNDPYQIATAADLIALGETLEDYDKHFILTADIDLDPNLPGRKVFDKAVIAADVDQMEAIWHRTSFGGVFDGNGHTISNLRIEGRSGLGLFGHLWCAEIRNVGVVDVNITGSGGAIGGLVGLNAGDSITHCYSTGVVSGTSDVGGLVGRNYDGQVTQCYSTGAVSGNESVGGLVGYSFEFTAISYCYSSAAVSGKDFVGGLVGTKRAPNAFLTQCYSTGTVSGKAFVGGLVGYGESTREVNGFWDIQSSGQPTSPGGTGKTTPEMQTAKTFLDAGWDFVGETANGSDDIWKIAEGLGYPRLSWEKYSGGMGEPNDPYQIATAADLIALGETPEDYDKHFLLTADIDLDPNLPGRKVFDRAVIDGEFTGVFDGDEHTISHLTIIGGVNGLGLFSVLGNWDGGPYGYIKNLGLVDVNIVGTGDCVGGLMGVSYGPISACYSTGTICGRSSVGGLVGHQEYDQVTRCHSTACVRGSGQDVGGLVGYVYFCGSVTHCYSTGTVSGNERVGGLVGSSRLLVGYISSNLTQCYSTGAVNGNACVGGLVGRNECRVTQCYSTGAVSGDHEVGGLVGSNWGTVTQCFWDTQTSGQTASVGGTGKTTAEMQTANTFLEAGWDFVGETTNSTEDIWWINEGKDYPRLSWEPRKYGGGSGGPNDPYLIFTAEQMNAIGTEPNDWGKHFKLMADIELSGFDGKDGRPAFNAIGQYDWPEGDWEPVYYVPGPPFTGVFDGNGHTISHLIIERLTCVAMFVYLASGAEIKNLGVVDVNVTGTGGAVNGTGGVAGGLVAYNECGSVTCCYSTGVVRGAYYVGGLVGCNAGTVTNSYAMAKVVGDASIGGFVGANGYWRWSMQGPSWVPGAICNCFSAGAVIAGKNAGGLVGRGVYFSLPESASATVTSSFWDAQASGQPTSGGGTGKSTAEMKTAKTFTDAGWDFVGETANGTEDIWKIAEGLDYPRLWWETTEE